MRDPILVFMKESMPSVTDIISYVHRVNSGDKVDGYYALAGVFLLLSYLEVE